MCISDEFRIFQYKSVTNILFVLYVKVEIPKHELEHSETAVEEEEEANHTQFEVEMVKFECLISLKGQCHGDLVLFH